MANVVLVGTLDSKSTEYAWLRERIEAHGVTTTTIDVGTFSDAEADISAREVAEAADTSIEQLRESDDRGAAMTAMGQGAAAIVAQQYAEGGLQGIVALGGSGGSSVAATAMQALPVGVPKLLVSTVAAGDTTPYVGAKDVTMMPSIVDIAGINQVSAEILANAAAAIAAMAGDYEQRQAAPVDRDARPLVAATMFGVTTPAVDEARARLEELGYEVLVFHATGSGGKAMEALAADGFLAGVLDLTTTELADELIGGVLSAGPDRLSAAGTAGLPQVVSVGALDMCNFGPEDSIPEKFAGRSFVVHNPTVTLMRTTTEENAELGRQIAHKLAAASGPTEIRLPLRGISLIDVDGGPFYDPAADSALFDAIRSGLEGTNVTVVEEDAAINDEGFGRRAAERLHELITKENDG
ncbi:UPF0261 family protein [Epidermidibacterium keratini]|uniref:UPF0261 family protein n=1 Tax=Epidermidibacterium keratini TaxID=1891644 RepID=A0A7L4YPA0_9ACTN|nr:Tm-1-like ATP-binding domain-containing protein [Epidermidibacterium keratini]QHC00387.1 UPF0261 family protein [Epidermidibacterium keratini]